MYSWKWNLSELNPDKEVKVFSTFSCGGVALWVIKELVFRYWETVKLTHR